MNLRRYKDLIAFKCGSSPAVAFHARNLSVAEISEEAWDSLSPTHCEESRVFEKFASASSAIDDLSSWEQFEDPQTASSPSTFGIRSLTLNVTQICNLHCTYCAAGGDGTYGDPIKKIAIEKTIPQLDFFLSQRKHGESFHIAFLGGEPLLYPEAIEAIGSHVLAVSHEKGLHPSFKVTTNGTLITDRTLSTLQKLGAHVVVSIDGPAEIHDRQRKTKSGAGSFEATSQGLLRLLEHKKTLGSVGAHAVFNAHNLDVEKSWDYLSSLDIDFLEFTFTVDHEDLEATRVYNEGLQKVAEKAWSRGGEKELLRISNFKALFDRLDQQVRLENHCGIGKSMLVVDSRNRLWNCPWTIGQTADLVGEGQTLDYDRLEGYEGNLIERNQCGDCWARFLCGGGCSFVHESTANRAKLNKKNDYCTRTRFLTSLAVIYYQRARTENAG